MPTPNDIRLTPGLDKVKIKYLDKFAGIVAKKLNESPIMQWTAKTGIKIENGSLIYFKAGADEELEAARSAVDVNAWSNIEGELKIPFNTEYSTKAVLLDKNEYQQFNLDGNPQALNDQSLSVKADKVRKLIGRVTMGLWMTGKTEDGLDCGDGPVTTHSFEWKTNLASNTRQEIAEDFDKFQRFMDLKIEEIKRIGINDATGKNVQDPYRTGVTVDKTNYKVATSPDFRRRYQIWVSVYNQTVTNLQQDSYGNLNGFDLYEDIFLPYVGITTKGMTAKSSYGNTNKIEIIEGTQSVEFMFIKVGNLIKGNVFDFMWDKKIDRTEAHLVGWSGKLGAGTIFPDEMFAIDFAKVTPPPAPTKGKNR
ncbi:hypothetical protein [Spiroplasma sp. SV19]|uniref:hypothetical protein n=1 Tax=Spiroplasma sp. SV19 TaxID=2570468 RepID=UPI0024B7FCBC|nr:hypothetical protein [Spiroplasma sp. SV19]WHQ37184.1 hypothetical protein E7Y35_04750 [Spiroplasma sp. SV19]